MEKYIDLCVKLAGALQLLLFVGSFAIPKNLRLGERVVCLEPFIRQMFWTYACYILVSHLFFGLISVFLTIHLLHNPLGNVLLLFMGVWWLARIGVQIFYFDRSGIPYTLFNKIAEALLFCLFIFLTLTYIGGLICMQFI